MWGMKEAHAVEHLKQQPLKSERFSELVINQLKPGPGPGPGPEYLLMPDTNRNHGKLCEGQIWLYGASVMICHK